VKLTKAGETFRLPGIPAAALQQSLMDLESCLSFVPSLGAIEPPAATFVAGETLEYQGNDPLSLRLNDRYLPWLLGTFTITVSVALLPEASRHSMVIV